MRYYDRATDETRHPDDVAELLDALLRNRQLFGETDQGDRPYVTDAVKYTRERQDRRAVTPYDGDNEFVERVSDIFEFDPLDFQAESWQTVERLHRQTERRGESTAAVLSAPTGFGKTEAFLGALFQLLLDDRQDGVAVVYPRKALLQDQLGRILKYVHRIGEQTGTDLSVGLYSGGQPYKNQNVGRESYVETSAGGADRFALSNCWCGEDGDAHAFEVTRNSRGYDLQCENDPSHHFDFRQLVLPRSRVVYDDKPDILLTTLESLESFALKPNYDLVDHIDTVVLDEVHLYTQLRGAHAARVVRNVDEVSEGPLRWIGSSATIDDADRFGRRIFGVDDDSRIETVEPPDSDYDDDHDDSVHYYFASAAADVSVSSMAIQQLMLLGHTLTGPDEDGDESKVLSFIDSISQVNQKSTQFHNADTNRELWRYHFGGDGEEDWPAVASSFDRTFVDEPLDTTRVYSDEGFDAGETADSDMLLSTSFLEVGIDVGDIGVVTQYRTPWDLSSFQQRAGRAGRERGDDAHVVVLLSNLTGDANMFYRAGRFLDSEIRTPLKVDNPVVNWIHDKLYRYTECAKEVAAEYREAFEPKRTEHLEFLDRFLREELGYDAVYELLTDPEAFFDSRFDRSVDTPSEPLLSASIAEEVADALTATSAAIEDDLDDLTEHFDRDRGTVVRGSEAVEEYTLRVRDRLHDLIDSFRGQRQGYVERIDAEDETVPEVAETVREQLVELRETVSAATGGSWAPSEAMSKFDRVVDDLFAVTGQMRRVRRAADRASDEHVPGVNVDRLEETGTAVERLRDFQSDDRLERYFDQRTELFYLQQAIEELQEYLDLNPYKSLYGVKHLLRCCYYVSRFREVAGEDPEEEVWFVPPDYYGSAGQFVTVFDDENAIDGTQESIDSIISTYVPYRSEYQSDDGTLRAFLPRTEVTDDGTVEFAFTDRVDGRQHDGVLIPDEIQLTEYEDLAGEEAQNVVQYCPDCLAHTEGDCLRHGTHEEGKIHAEPEVSTRLSDPSVDEREGNLTLADVSPTVTLEGVTLEITPAKPMYVDGREVFRFASERIERRIESPDHPLGFELNTRGLVFDLEPFLDSLADGVPETVAQYQREDATADFEYVVHHTAAHFFLQLVADVSSVNTTNLLYGFDREKREVYVFERTEGGQGVVDLAFEEIDRDPGSVLESLVRVGYNPQVETERLWADDDFVTDLDPDTDETTVRSTVTAALDTPFERVHDQVTQEVLAGLDRCRQLGRDSESLSTADALRVKHIVAAEQVAGERDYPESAVEAAVDGELDHDRLETLFHSPDIDDCVETLQLSSCIAGMEQGDALSYVVAERLRGHLLRVVDTTEAVETMFSLEATPAAEFDATSIFLDF